MALWTDADSAPTESTDMYNDAYFPASTEISWELIVYLKGTNIGKKYTSANIQSQSSTTTLTTSAKEWKKITFSPSSTQGAINVTITTIEGFAQTNTYTATLDPISGGENYTANN